MSDDNAPVPHRALQCRACWARWTVPADTPPAAPCPACGSCESYDRFAPGVVVWPEPPGPPRPVKVRRNGPAGAPRTRRGFIG